MSANSAFHIAVLPGDGIGHEVMAPALEVLRRVAAATPSLEFRFSEAPAGAEEYRATGKSMSEKTIKLCEGADAILLGACGLPSVRYPDNTEIMPQVELRFIFDLYAGVRPARLIPGVPSPIVGAAEHGIDFVLIRESTEGLFASMGKGVVTNDEARETLVVTRKTTERLFDFSLQARRAAQEARPPGRLTLVDKANVFKAFNWQRADIRRAQGEIPRCQNRPALCRCLRRADGEEAVGLRRHGDGEHVRRHSLRSRRRADRRARHRALRRHRRQARRVPALPRHRARHHGPRQGQPDRDDLVRRR